MRIFTLRIRPPVTFDQLTDALVLNNDYEPSDPISVVGIDREGGVAIRTIKTEEQVRAIVAALDPEIAKSIVHRISASN